MFKINTAVANFPVGNFISATTGLEVTTGTPTGTFTADAAVGTITGSPSYDATALQWIWSSVQAAAMNGAIVGLTFNLAGCLPIHYTIRTSSKLVSDLNDAATAPSASDNATATAAVILVTPANKLTTDADGAVVASSTNVTTWRGDVPSPLDVDGNVPTAPTAVDIDTRLSATHGAGAWGAGSGASSVVYTVYAADHVTPLAGVIVTLTTDSAGLNIVDQQTTNAAGQVTLRHDLASGTTVYLRRFKAGAPFSDPDVEVIP